MNNVCLDLVYDTRHIVPILSDDNLDMFAKTVAEHLSKLADDVLYMFNDDQSMNIVRSHVQELTHNLMDMNLPVIEFEFSNDDKGKCSIQITKIIQKSLTGNIFIPFYSWPQCHQFVEKLHKHGFG